MNQTGIDSDKIDPRIGERLMIVRRRRGISQRTLARQAGLSATTVNRVERGLQTIAAERLAVIVRLLGTSSDFILGLDEDPDAGPQPMQTRHRTAASVS